MLCESVKGMRKLEYGKGEGFKGLNLILAKGILEIKDFIGAQEEMSHTIVFYLVPKLCLNTSFFAPSHFPSPLS